jgi:homospermidine synthase
MGIWSGAGLHELAWSWGEGHPLQRARHADSDVPKAVDEFVNTWRSKAFREEGITTQIGWGTHEKELPRGIRAQSGEKNKSAGAHGMNKRVALGVALLVEGMVVRNGGSFGSRLSCRMEERKRSTRRRFTTPIAVRRGVHFAARTERPQIRTAAKLRIIERRNHGKPRHPRRLLMGLRSTRGGPQD